MSTKLMKPDEKPSATENLGAKRGNTSESCQTPDPSVQPKQPDGNLSTPVMTEDEVMDLLARLQDILSLWKGSDNKIIGNYVMAAFPIPPSMKVDKVEKKGSHDKLYTVNGVPVVNAE
jgi:hypothetical protein